MGNVNTISTAEFFTFMAQLLFPFLAGYLAAKGLRQWGFIAKYTVGFVVTMLLAPMLLIVILMFLPADSGAWIWLGGQTSGALNSLFDAFIFLIQKAGLVAVAAMAGLVAGLQKRVKS